jgi:hypothetical protein
MIEILFLDLVIENIDKYKIPVMIDEIYKFLSILHQN